MTAPVTGRLAGKVAIVSGAGQAPGETIGNGKAIALFLASDEARFISGAILPVDGGASARIG